MGFCFSRNSLFFPSDIVHTIHTKLPKWSSYARIYDDENRYRFFISTSLLDFEINFMIGFDQQRKFRILFSCSRYVFSLII